MALLCKSFSCVSRPFVLEIQTGVRCFHQGGRGAAGGRGGRGGAGGRRTPLVDHSRGREIVKTSFRDKSSVPDLAPRSPTKVRSRTATSTALAFLAFGDAFTFGISEQEHQTSYTDYLQKLFKIKTYNSGVPFETTTDMVARMPDELDFYIHNFHISHVLIWGGAHDLANGEKPQVIRTNLIRMHTLAHQRHVKSIALPILDCALDFPGRAQINAELKSFCQDEELRNQHLLYPALFIDLCAELPFGRNHPDWCDLCFLSSKGHQKVADVIANKLRTHPDREFVRRWSVEFS